MIGKKKATTTKKMQRVDVKTYVLMQAALFGKKSAEFVCLNEAQAKDVADKILKENDIEVENDSVDT